MLSINLASKLKNILFILVIDVHKFAQLIYHHVFYAFYLKLMDVAVV